MAMKKRIKIQSKLKWEVAILILVVVMVLAIMPGSIITKVQQITSADIIVLDPGHGGRDGGAESALGINEKDINLAIAMYIKELAEIDGWKVVMTRDKDVGLYNEQDRGIRSLKTQDLLGRKKIIEKVKPNLAVSIHLNSFKQDTSVRGAQTFFPLGVGDQIVLDDSKRLAENIQEKLVMGIADGTDRAALGKRDVLLFKKPIVPMAMVECGFLSNRAEAELLQSEDYQRKLAKFIYEGIMKYSGKEPKIPVETIDSRG